MAHPLDRLRQLDPTYMTQIESLRELALAPGSIPLKYKLLIGLAIDTVEKSESGIKSLAEQAVAAGATADEIAETLRVVGWIAGIGPLYSAARALKDLT